MEVTLKIKCPHCEYTNKMVYDIEPKDKLSPELYNFAIKDGIERLERGHEQGKHETEKQ